MLGYTYATEQLANEARTLCASYKGLPNSQGDTLYWVNYDYSDLDNIYYIVYTTGLENVLGTPIEFTITFPEIDHNPVVIQFPIEKKQFTLETSYFIESDLQATVCLRPSDPEISDYLASNFTFPNEQEALDEIYELAITQRPILFEKFQEMDNVPIEVREQYFL